MTAPGAASYRNREPVTVEAITWTGDNAEALIEFGGEEVTFNGGGEILLWNSHQRHWRALPAGWVAVRGHLGNLFPIDPVAFAGFYEPVTAPEPGPAAIAGTGDDDGTPEADGTSRGALNAMAMILRKYGIEQIAAAELASRLLAAAAPWFGVEADRVVNENLAAAAETGAAGERTRIRELFGEWIDILMAEPNAHPPSAWRAAFDHLIGWEPRGATPAGNDAGLAAQELNEGRSATWSGACAPGGWVCAVPDPARPDGICGAPVESEPCGEHGPADGVTP